MSQSKDQHVPRSGAVEDRRRGLKHLRVGVELSDQGAAITSMWVVDQPVIQHFDIPHTLVAGVWVGGEMVLVEGFEDPRLRRGVYRPGLGHHFGRTRSGTLYVSIPFEHAFDLNDIRVRVVPRADLPTTAIDADTMMRMVDIEGVAAVVELDTGTLQRHLAWKQVAKELGMPAVTGRFEIYIDKAGEYRWRLRGPGGQIHADSGEGHATRAECERELAWVRANARTTPVASLDVSSPGSSSPE